MSVGDKIVVSVFFVFVLVAAVGASFLIVFRDQEHPDSAWFWEMFRAVEEKAVEGSDTAGSEDAKEKGVQVV